MASTLELVKEVQKQLKGELSHDDLAKVVHAIETGSKKDKPVPLVRSGAVKVNQGSRPNPGKVERLAPKEERLGQALFAMIVAADVHGKEALRVIRAIGEMIEIAPDSEEEAFERVRLRSLGAGAELRDAEGGGLSDMEFATALGLSSRETIRQYREKGLIFAWRKDLRTYRYPAWQIHRKQLLAGLAEVLQVLKEKHLEALSILGYFLTPSDGLDGVRPLDLLREGEVSEVMADARRYGDIGA
jgi:hypothetical protein